MSAAILCHRFLWKRTCLRIVGASLLANSMIPEQARSCVNYILREQARSYNITLHTRTFTYLPGAGSMGLNFALPTFFGAARSPPAKPSSHAFQFDHQLPGTSSAPASHSSALADK